MNNPSHHTPAPRIHRHCPLCDRNAAGHHKSRYSRDDWSLIQCPACRFVYLEDVLPYSELIQGHSWTKTFARERQQRREREPLFSLFSRMYKRFRLRYLWHHKGPSYIARYIDGENLLDIGCGSGFVLQQLPSRFTPYGIEIDENAAQVAHRFATSRGGFVVHRDALAGLEEFDDQHIDGVLMQSFLEHENQPLLVLQQVARVLRPGGRVIIKVPNFASWNRLVRRDRWCGFRFPDHVNYFTPRTLSQMVQLAGLNVTHFGLLRRQPTSDNMWLVAQRSQAPTGIKRAA